MKKTNLNVLKTTFYLFMGISVALTSCSGKDGEDGEDGFACWDANLNGQKDNTEDVNDDGTVDLLDCQGPQGVPGSDGNANVIASDWMQIQWDEAIPTEATMILDVPELDLTDFVETGGVVLVYFKLRSGESFITFPLPFTFNSATYGYYTITNADTGIIAVEAEDPDSELILDIQNDPDFTLRYVLVPANVAEQNGISEKSPTTFEQASKLLGIN